MNKNEIEQIKADIEDLENPHINLLGVRNIMKSSLERELARLEAQQEPLQPEMITIRGAEWIRLLNDKNELQHTVTTLRKQRDELEERLRKTLEVLSQQPSHAAAAYCEYVAGRRV